MGSSTVVKFRRSLPVSNFKVEVGAKWRCVAVCLYLVQRKLNNRPTLKQIHQMLSHLLRVPDGEKPKSRSLRARRCHKVNYGCLFDLCGGLQRNSLKWLLATLCGMECTNQVNPTVTAT
jgi:hypothetical protein